ncbi:LADA_0F04764g1_1 [Lachancea dasiensis]|uniref:LADA_0F04764g1_1 n=1 Tax=Lachancea dasiensis TaxID=1072105 RepID=A0A1G4JJ67_9SACH|nr:LADA_0F04764g1_1 [Lachancea dasiensis]
MGLLNSHDKEKIKRALPKSSNKIVDVTVARLYIAYPNPQEWQYTGLSGAVALVDDIVGHTFFLKLVDIQGHRGVVWDQELYVGFDYHQDRTFFHTFELEECTAGLLFEDLDEAAHLLKRVQKREKYASKKTLANKNAIALAKKLHTEQEAQIVQGPRGESLINDQRQRYRIQDTSSDVPATKKKAPPPPPPAAAASFSSPPPLAQGSVSELARAPERAYESPSPAPFSANITQDPSSESEPSSASASLPSTPAPPAKQLVHRVPPLPATNTSFPNGAPPAPPSASPIPPPVSYPAPPVSAHPQRSSNNPFPLPVPQSSNPHPVAPPLPQANAPMQVAPPLPQSGRPLPGVPPRGNGPPAPPPRRNPGPPPPPRRVTSNPTGNSIYPASPVAQAAPAVPSRALPGAKRPGPPPPPRRSAGPAPPPRASRATSAPPPPQRTLPVSSSPPLHTFPQPSTPLTTTAALVPPAPPIPQVSGQQHMPPPPPLPQTNGQSGGQQFAAPLPPPAPPMQSAPLSAVPPPPPPPPPAMTFEPPQAGNVGVAPPPPPAFLSQSQQPSSGSNEATGDAGRDALLASIRGAGGVTALRKTDKSQLEKPSVLLQESNGNRGSQPNGSTGAAGSAGGGPPSMADALAAALNQRKSKVAQDDGDYDNGDDW